MSGLTEAWPLADYLIEEMTARGWTTDDVGKRMAPAGEIAIACFEAGLLISVAADDLVIQDATFEQLGNAFDVSPDLFRNLHQAWKKSSNRRECRDVPDSLYGPITRYLIDRASAGRAALASREDGRDE